MIRLAVLGLWHEANTFAAAPVDDAYVEAMGVLRGGEPVARHTGGTSTVSGFLAAGAADPGVEPVRALRETGRLDGVLATLHGAAVAEGVPDVDGYLLGRFREVVGPDLPVGEVRPSQAFGQVPAVINILCQHTDEPPMRDILADARAVMAEPGVLSATVAEGYPYADVPELGMSVAVVTDGDPACVPPARRRHRTGWPETLRERGFGDDLEESSVVL